MRLSAEYLEHDGFIENVTRDEKDFDARENTTLRGKILLEPTDQLSIYANVQYLESNRGQDQFRFDLNDDISDRQAFDNLPSREDLDGYLYTLDVNYDFNDRWALRSITSAMNMDYDRFDDDDAGPEGGNAFRGREATDENWAQELRLEYTGASLRGTVGLYYIEEDIPIGTSVR